MCAVRRPITSPLPRANANATIAQCQCVMRMDGMNDYAMLAWYGVQGATMQASRQAGGVIRSTRSTHLSSIHIAIVRAAIHAHNAECVFYRVAFCDTEKKTGHRKQTKAITA